MHAEALALLRGFPYWPHAARDQSPEQVARFALGLLEGGHSVPYAGPDGQLQALYVRQDLPWDSEKLGLKCARATFIVAPSSQVGAQMCAAAVSEARTAGYGYLFTRIDARDLVTVQACEHAGFVTVDSILSQYLVVEASCASAPLASGVSIREAGPQDAELLAELVDATLERSRFHDDPKVGPERGRAIYREWAKNSVNGLNQFTAIAYVDGTAAGFLSVKDNAPARDAFGYGYGRIELVAVRTEFRGRGLVTALTDCLVTAAPRLGWQRLGIGTQCWNVAAIRAYQKAGFAPGDAIFSMRWRVDDCR